MYRTPVLLTALGLMMGCGSARERLTGDAVSAAFAAANAQGVGTRVVLAEAAGRGWRQVFIFGPYTPVAAVARCLGRPATGVTQGIESRDDANLLVFEFSGRQPMGMVVPRSAGDFAPEVLQRAYSPAQAVFVVRRPPAGSWGNLMPAGGPTNRCS